MNYYKDENDKVYAFNDLQVKQGVPSDLTLITEDEKDTILTVVLTDEQQAKSDALTAHAYLDSTDKYMTVDKYKQLTSDEAGNLESKREAARVVIREYEDKYLTE